jgi:hypothetical protein
MGQVNQLWQDEKQRALTRYLSGATTEERARRLLRQLGLSCDSIENELSAAKDDQP